jgi:hypothetical protein
MRVQSGELSQVRLQTPVQIPQELEENLILTFLTMALIHKSKVIMQVNSKNGLIVRVLVLKTSKLLKE